MGVFPKTRVTPPLFYLPDIARQISLVRGINLVSSRLVSVLSVLVRVPLVTRWAPIPMPSFVVRTVVP